MQFRVIGALFCFFFCMNCGNHVSPEEKLLTALHEGRGNEFLEALKEGKGSDSLYELAANELIKMANAPDGSEKISRMFMGTVVPEKITSKDGQNELLAFLIVTAEVIHRKTNSKNPSLNDFPPELIHAAIACTRLKLTGVQQPAKLEVDLKNLEEESRKFVQEFSLDQIKKLRIRW